MPGSDQSHPQPIDGEVKAPTFADELPNGCPPAEATDAVGTFYATHRMFPAGSGDFRTAAENDRFKGSNECRRRGNSILGSLEDARQLCRAYPDIHVHVSEGVLEPKHGKLLKTRSQYPSHHTLWRYAGVTMHAVFVKVV